jgi:hypothetical protein
MQTLNLTNLAFQSSNKPIIFIDSSVENYQSLITGADKNAQIVILEKDRSGVEQITQALRNWSNIKALHIVSHGSPGSLQLGSDILKGENLDSFSSLLQQWGKALTKTADILVYGCEVAAGEIGEKFIKRLNKIIGANIAASSHKIGNATLGGDWKLDKTIGSIQTPLAFSAQAMKSYGGVLATADFNVSSIFTDDIIVNYTGGVTDTTQTAIDNSNYATVTQSFANYTNPTSGNGLLDDGLFTANSYHPAIQLGYNNNNNGNNARMIIGATAGTNFNFSVTSGQYNYVHLATTSTQGSSNLSLTLNYSDGTNQTTSTQTIPDWYDSITESNTLYYLADNLDRSLTNSTGFQDANAPANFWGLGLPPIPPRHCKVLQLMRPIPLPQGVYPFLALRESTTTPPSSMGLTSLV